MRKLWTHAIGKRCKGDFSETKAKIIGTKKKEGWIKSVSREFLILCLPYPYGFPKICFKPSELVTSSRSPTFNQNETNIVWFEYSWTWNPQLSALFWNGKPLFDFHIFFSLISYQPSKRSRNFASEASRKHLIFSKWSFKRKYLKKPNVLSLYELCNGSSHKFYSGERVREAD